MKNKVVTIDNLNTNELSDKKRKLLIDLTEKKIYKYQVLTFSFLLCAGIGFFLPFGMKTKRLMQGLNQLKNKELNKNIGYEWVIAGCMYSLIHLFISLFFKNINKPLIVNN